MTDCFCCFPPSPCTCLLARGCQFKWKPPRDKAALHCVQSLAPNVYTGVYLGRSASVHDSYEK